MIRRKPSSSNRTPTLPQPQNPPVHPQRWRIAWLLGLGVLVNYFDRVNLSVSHDALVATFGISAITFGYLSAAYNWTYALCQLPIGVLLDRFGVRRIGRISTFIWSLASFAAALTPSVPGFFAARLLLGIGEAPTFPANAKATGLWFPQNERSLATAIFDSAAKFAPAVGVPILGILLLKIGWRWSFAITGLISLAYFALFSLTYSDPPATPPEITSESPSPNHTLTTTAEPPPAPLTFLMRQRKVIGLALGFGSYNYVFYLLLTWLPTYLSATLHIDLLHSFLYTGLPWLFATIMDFAGGALADTLIQRGYNDSLIRRTVLVAGTTLGLGILGAAHAHTITQALFWISLSIGGLSAAAPIGWSIPSMIAPPGSTGTVGGILNFSNQLSGIAAPILTGYVVAATHSYTWAFVIAAIYLIAGIAAYLFLLGKVEPIPFMSVEP